MKKIVLSLSALFAVSIAAAQSYPKQPDPKVYNVVKQVPATKAAETDETADRQEVNTEAHSKDETIATEGQPAKKPEKVETSPATAVAENEAQ